MTRNVFAEYENKIYPYRYAGEMEIRRLMGGMPTDKNVAEGWLKAKMGLTKEDAIQQAVAAVMEARAMSKEGPISEADALKEVDISRHLNGFGSDEDGLYVEGRHLKAGIKEAVSIARTVGNLSSRYGLTSKGTIGFAAEHIVVVEELLHLYQKDLPTGKVVNVTEPTGVRQSFPKNPRTNQTGIQYTEYVDNAIVAFTIACDYEFTPDEWAAIWVTGSKQGLGASRSQGFGRYTVTKWSRLKN